MQDTDAVSCILCLQADEYGSMIKVCVPPGRIPPSTEKVICRLCAGIIATVLDGQEGEVSEQRSGADSDREHDRVDDPGSRAGVGDDWDSDLPERATESLVETNQSEPGNPPGSSKE